MHVRLAFVVTLAHALVSGARAEVLPTLPARELTIRADTIVLAEPLAAGSPGRFRVTELIKGAAPRRGAEIEVQDLDRYVHPGELPDWGGVDASLLFLKTGGNGSLELVESGLRLHTRDRKVWWPIQPVNPGGYQMVVTKGASWDATIASVRYDAAEVTHLRRACELADAARRDRYLLDWIERHRNEFSDGRDIGWLRTSPSVANHGPEEPDVSDLYSLGWGELQLLPFTRIMQSCVPADCWQAVNLYAELNQGSLPSAAAAAFSSKEGRAWLLAVARDPRKLDGQRARALQVLGDREVNSQVPADSRERTSTLSQLVSFLSDRSPQRRGLAALAMRRFAGKDEPAAESVVTVLSNVYKLEQPGWARNALAEALYEVGGPQRWSKATGRPGETLALLRDAAIRDEKLLFWVTVRTEPSVPITAAPSLVLQRLDAKGSVMETKKVPIALPASAKSGGWNGSPLYVEVNHSDWKPGGWRIRVTGVAGPAKTAWESEPRTLRVTAAGSSRPPRSVWSSLIRSVTGTPEPDEQRAADGKAKRIVELDGEAL
jgi:hypothetical protein